MLTWVVVWTRPLLVPEVPPVGFRCFSDTHCTIPTSVFVCVEMNFKINVMYVTSILHSIFTLSNPVGGSVVHSYGRLIPHEFPITDLQQTFGPDGIGRITCTVSSGTATFSKNVGQVEGGGVTKITNGATATLVVNVTDVGSFHSRALYCTNININFFYMFISSTS